MTKKRTKKAKCQQHGKNLKVVDKDFDDAVPSLHLKVRKRSKRKFRNSTVNNNNVNGVCGVSPLSKQFEHNFCVSFSTAINSLSISYFCPLAFNFRDPLTSTTLGLSLETFSASFDEETSVLLFGAVNERIYNPM